MKQDQHLADLHTRWKQVTLLESTAAVLGWDEQVMMPQQGSAWRSEQLAYLAGLVHQELIAKGLDTCLSELEQAPPADPFNRASVHQARRRQSRAIRIPRSLVEELARTTSLATACWVTARQKSQFTDFLPWLEKIIHLKRQEADAVGWTNHPYDALLDEYEPGATTAGLDQLFGKLEEPLSLLVASAIEQQASRKTGKPHGDFPLESQRALGFAAAKILGFRFDSGRLDASTHPFCSGVGPGDCRLTTRYRTDGFLESFFGVLHETGHGLYEQGMPDSSKAEPWCQAASLGIHESQSRLWENQVGRSRPFWDYFYPIASALFGSQLDDWPLERLQICFHEVRPSLIRVEADETTYNLHIILRYSLERSMIDGSLAPADLPHAWNTQFERLLRLKVPDDRQGCLQDIHWSGGGIGYFPTYTLGNMYAAQFMCAARRDIPRLDDDFRQGNFAPLLAWLRDKVHRLGRSITAEAICRQATGSILTPIPLLQYLKSLQN